MSKKGSGNQYHIKHKDLYRVWASMKDRCFNPKHKFFNRYGGRGISVCSNWIGIELFLSWALSSGYKKGLELDRTDNNGDYEPSNCRWVVRRTNVRNRNNKSKLGSCIYQQSKGFLVRVYKNKKLHNLGTHESVELAQLVRDTFTGTDSCGGYSH